jgi:hypothetical protein
MCLLYFLHPVVYYETRAHRLINTTDYKPICLMTGKFYFCSTTPLDLSSLLDGFYELHTLPKLALGSTQPPIQWVLGAHSLEIKWPGHEADHSPSTSAEV